MYTDADRNIVGIRGFKEHLALWFFNGVLLKDHASLLSASTENTQAMRQIRLTRIQEIEDIQEVLCSYVL